MADIRKNEEESHPEKDRISKLLRKCSMCNIFKPKCDYSESQWGRLIEYSYYGYDTKTRHCLLCLSKEIEYEAYLLELFKKAKQYALELYKNCRCVCYSLDGDKFLFTEIISLERLVGSYDIIFSAAYANKDTCTQRTCNGTLMISTSTNDGDGNRNGIYFCGAVIMDDIEMDGEHYKFGVDFSMKQLTRDSNNFEVLGEVANEYGDYTKGKATIRKIKSRVVLPWEDPLSDISCTVEDATALICSQLSTNYEKSWIVNHLPILNSDIAKRIHEFASPWKPNPVFYVEPGDLLIEVIWNDGYCIDCESYLIARRRVELK